MKKSNFARVFALVMAVMMLCSAFLVGCGGDPKQTQTQGNKPAQTQTSTEEVKDTYEAEIKDLQGHEFVFYVKDVKAQHLNYNEVFAEEITGDKVNDAVFKRNAEIQTVYNCTISEVRDASPATVLRDPLVTGEYVCDFIFVDAPNARTLAKNSLLVDFATIENVDLTKSWYDEQALKGLNMAGKVFFVTGDACTIDDRACILNFFNLELVENWDSEVDLYQEVRDGKWTVARMLEVMQGTAMDVDGDGVVATYQKDIYGWMAGNTIGNWMTIASFGTYLSNVSEDGSIDVPMTPKRELLDAWAAAKPLLTTPLRMCVDNLPSGNIFRSGKSTFYGCNLGSLLNWGDQNFRLGILPYPKKDEAQEEYWCCMNLSQVGGYCIPTTVENDPAKDWEKAGFTSAAEMCGYFMEAFNYYSVDTLTPALFEQVLGKQMMMDTESTEMMELGIKNRNYDPVVGYNFGGMRTLFAECGGINDHPGTDVNYENFTSKYMEKINKARDAVQDYLTFLDPTQATA